MGQDIIIYKDAIQKITYYRRDTKSETIYAYFRVNNKTYRFSTGKTSREEAVKVGNKKKHLASKGKTIKKITFSKLLNKYLEYQRSRVSAKHFSEIERNGKILLEYFGNRDLTSKPITEKSIVGLENWRRNYYSHNSKKKTQKYTRNGKKITGRTFNTTLSNRTINVTVKLAVSVLRYAAKHQLINDKAPQFSALKEGKRKTFIEESELERLYNHFIEKEKQFCAYVVGFCFYTGARYPSETYNLQWKDIDFTRKTILIKNRKHKTKVLNSTVPMLPPVETILQHLAIYQKDRSDEDFVFRTASGIRIKNISKSFKNALKELGFDLTMSMYSLRHSFITHLVENYRNIPLKMIAEVAGHSDTTMIEGVYGHLREDITINAFMENHKELASKGKISSNLISDEKQL